MPLWAFVVHLRRVVACLWHRGKSRPQPRPNPGGLHHAVLIVKFDNSDVQQEGVHAGGKPAETLVAAVISAVEHSQRQSHDELLYPGKTEIAGDDVILLDL